MAMKPDELNKTETADMEEDPMGMPSRTFGMYIEIYAKYIYIYVGVDCMMMTQGPLQGLHWAFSEIPSFCSWKII